MDRLWAPWRMPFIKNLHKPKGCFLCDAWRSHKDRDHRVVYRGKRVFAIMNIYPYNNGHLMIAPARHTGDLDRITDAEWREMIQVLKICRHGLKKAFAPQGFNVGINEGKIAGAGVDKHLHIHVVPRWSGDSNFMPVLAATKVLPQALEAGYEEIVKAIKHKR